MLVGIWGLVLNKDELTTQLLAAKQMGTGGFIWFLDSSRSTVNSSPLPPSQEQQNPRDGPLPAGDGKTDGAATDDTRPAQRAKATSQTQRSDRQTSKQANKRETSPPPASSSCDAPWAMILGNTGTWLLSSRSEAWYCGSLCRIQWQYGTSTTDMGVCSRRCGGEGRGDAGIGVFVSSWIACFLFPPCLDGLLGGFHRLTILSPPSHAGQATVSS